MNVLQIMHDQTTCCGTSRLELEEGGSEGVMLSKIDYKAHTAFLDIPFGPSHQSGYLESMTCRRKLSVGVGSGILMDRLRRELRGPILRGLPGAA